MKAAGSRTPARSQRESAFQRSLPAWPEFGDVVEPAPEVAAGCVAVLSGCCLRVSEAVGAPAPAALLPLD